MTFNIELLERRENPSTFTPKVPVELWQQLAADVRILAEGTVKPSQESVQTLVTTVQSAVADGVLTTREKLQISAAANAVLASANIPVSEVQAVANDIRAILAVYVG